MCVYAQVAPLVQRLPAARVYAARWWAMTAGGGWDCGDEANTLQQGRHARRSMPFGAATDAQHGRARGSHGTIRLPNVSGQGGRLAAGWALDTFSRVCLPTAAQLQLLVAGCVSQPGRQPDHTRHSDDDAVIMPRECYKAVRSSLTHRPRSPTLTASTAAATVSTSWRPAPAWSPPPRGAGPAGAGRGGQGARKGGGRVFRGCQPAEPCSTVRRVRATRM